MKNIKNKRSIIFMLVILLIGIFGVTFAIFYTHTEKSNEFKAADYKVSLEENFDPSPWPNPTTKQVSIKNTGTAPVIVRMSYNETWTNGDIILNNLVNGQNAVVKTWSSTFGSDWIFKDGWYYYTKVLNGKSSVNILQSIQINNSVIDATSVYRSSNYELIFNYEAIEATTKAVSSLWGHNVTISSGNINWGF